jgi:hypothetical protein
MDMMTSVWEVIIGSRIELEYFFADFSPYFWLFSMYASIVVRTRGKSGRLYLRLTGLLMKFDDAHEIFSMALCSRKSKLVLHQGAIFFQENI